MADIAADGVRVSAFDHLMLQERINKLIATAGQELSAVNLDLIPWILDKINQIKDQVDTGAGLGRLFHIHGDLHLEQVLKTASTWKVIDFEGEPLKTIAEREALDSPLKDLASLLRSVGYRVHTATGGSADLENRLQMALVNGYRECQDDFFPTGANFEPLLNLFQLERVIYELSYEAKYRPEWLSIPLAGLEQLLGR
jgi:maltokinase